MNRPHKERRKNWRLRQLLNCAYGLSLAVSTPQAAWATGSLPKLMAKPQQGDHGDPAAHDQVGASFRLVFLQLEPRDLLAATGTSLPVWDHRHPYNQSFLRALDAVDASRLDYSEHPLRQIRDGLGFDFDLPDAGNLHLNLYTNRQARSRGMRIDMADTRHDGQKLWSLGATLDSARQSGGSDAISIVPQLMLDLDGLFDTDLQWQALIEYGHWQPLRQRLTTNARVAQLSLRLRF